MDSFLYIGSSKLLGDDALPSFIGRNMIPLAWFLLFQPEDLVTRKELIPDSIKKVRRDFDLEQLAAFRVEPVAFRTTLQQGLENLRTYKGAFKSIPYIWSYFRVIEIIEQEIEKLFEMKEEIELEDLWAKIPKGKQKRSNLSQVKVKEEKQNTPLQPSLDNPFAELENFGSTSPVSETPPSTIPELGIAEDELLEVFSSLDEDLGDLFEQDETEDEIDELEQLENALDVAKLEDRYLIVQFNDLLDWQNGITGNDFAQILVFFERLLHHVEREGTMTRVMLEILQDIFREGKSEWRLTGQLSEDFLRDNPNRLVDITLGSPSPYIVLEETFDLEYWTNGTLQPGDERLMYALTLLPSEEIHRALETGKFVELAPSLPTILANTAQITKEKLKLDLLKLPPRQSNQWGFRVLIHDANGTRAGTFLISDPDLPWEEFFKKNLELPSVRQDWHIVLQMRLSEYTDVDEFTLEFAGAKDMDEAFLAFGRWIRRHQRLYWNKYGVEGTIEFMANWLLKTNDATLAFQIFDSLNQLTEFGFPKAVEVLGNEAIISKITTLYT